MINGNDVRDYTVNDDADSDTDDDDANGDNECLRFGVKAKQQVLHRSIGVVNRIVYYFFLLSLFSPFPFSLCLSLCISRVAAVLYFNF